MQFGTHLRAFRTRKGLSTRDLAELSGIDASHISRIENGATPPGEELMSRLAQALDVELDILMAYAGRVTLEVQAIITEHPREYIELVKQLKGSPADVVSGVLKAVREGKW